MIASVVQINSRQDRERNLDVAGRLVAEAAGQGAQLVVLPEKFNVMGDGPLMARSGESVDGPTLTWAKAQAARHGLWLVAGSIGESIPGETKQYNTSFLLGPDGTPAAFYRKIHIFDVDIEGVSYRGSEVERPGDEVVAVDAAGVPLGLTICYDLRFPELFRALALVGVRAVTLPAAFTERTGRDHWEPLIRARAIENQVFMLAANQIGRHFDDKVSYGRSMIVDPWGVVLAQAPDKECQIVARLDFDQQDRIRRDLPSLSSRRPSAYGRSED